MSRSLIDRILEADGAETFVLSRAEISRVFAKWIKITKEEPDMFDVAPDKSEDEHYADRQADWFIRVHKGEE